MSYVVTQNYIVAVDAAGERSWQILLPTYSFTSPLARLSLQEEYLIFEDTIVDASSGQRFFGQTGDPLDRYLVGADGSMYYNSTSSFFDWQPTEKGAVMTPVINLDERLLLTRYRIPFLVGVSPSQQAWLLYSSGFEYMRLVWVAQKGESLQITDFPYRTGRLIGIDSDGTAYVCGFPGMRVQLECRAVRIDSGMLLWKTAIDTTAAPVGGALLEGRLYVAIEDGKLFAIGR
jgi:outer membrane protein assembly factor BamB